VAATAAITGEYPGVLNVQGNIGFARRVSRTLTLDIGVLRSQYTARERTVAAHYSEFYAGASAHGFSARVYYSPDYLSSGVNTLYGEVDFAAEPIRNWQVSAHAGTQLFVANRPAPVPHNQYYDWRVGVSRRFGRFTAQAALSSGGPGQEYYAGGLHDRTALVGGIRFAF
jgi:uncharacterized protein (TIGR02001 family)